MNTLPDKITISLNDDEKVSVKGFIAPIEYAAGNFHKQWDCFGKPASCGTRKAIFCRCFSGFSPSRSRFGW